MCQKSKWAVIALLCLAGCVDDEDGQPTFIKGEVIGTLKNGQTLRETFIYTYSGGPERFDTNYLGQPSITLRRTNASGGSWMDIGLVLEDPSYPLDSLSFTSVTEGAFTFALQKELDAQTLLEVSCAGFQYATALRSLSLSANEQYQFVTDLKGNPIYKLVATKEIVTDLCCPNNTCCRPRYKFDYIFTNTAGDSIYYSRIGEPNDFPWEAPFNKIVSSAGQESSVSELYSKVKFTRQTIGEAFYEVSEPYDRSLLESYDMLDEGGVISNLVYDEATGRLTFNFSIRASGGNTTNTTGHDLQIAGTFDSGNIKLYKVLN